ncbi:MAG: T9SS type A sorting domain-containing protein [Bacteroidetes bacterium]|nr:T9SS type A sorting domain-containing protein [Bacteroidota bacterium]
MKIKYFLFALLLPDISISYLSFYETKAQVTTDTLYYLPDTARFIDHYLIAEEIYNIHTRFSPPTGWESYKVKEIQFLFSSMIIGDTLKSLNFYKDTLKTLVYSQPVNKKIDSSDVYPNWFKYDFPENITVMTGEIEFSSALNSVFEFCITYQGFFSGKTIGFYENLQNWSTTQDRPIKLVIEKIYTDVKDKEVMFSDFKLEQNYPNPFNPSTKIKYQIPKTGLVQLKVFDVLGREVEALVNEYQTAGEHSVQFSSSNSQPASTSRRRSEQTTNHKQLPSGVYFYQLKVGDFIYAKKMILTK